MFIISGKQFVINIDWDYNDGGPTFKYKDQVVGMHAVEADADEEVAQRGIPFSAGLFQPIQPFV